MSTAILERADNCESSLEDEVVRNFLQAYLGSGVRVRNHTPYLRKDYFGPASDKVRCGGALIVDCAVFDEQEQCFGKREIVIDENHRPLDENIITQLGAVAEANWLKGIGVTRDYCYDPRS